MTLMSKEKIRLTINYYGGKKIELTERQYNPISYYAKRGFAIAALGIGLFAAAAVASIKPTDLETIVKQPTSAASSQTQIKQDTKDDITQLMIEKPEVKTQIPQTTIEKFPETKTNDPYKNQIVAEIKEASERISSVDSYIAKANEETGLPKNLISAIVQTESKFKAYATSKSGAVGYSQFMEIAAKEIGMPLWKRTSPESIVFGAKYLKKLMTQFDNNLEIALAAYNAGPTKMQKLVNIHGLDWEKIRKDESISYETFRYPTKVLITSQIFAEKERYGISIPTFKPQIAAKTQTPPQKHIAITTPKHSQKQTAYKVHRLGKGEYLYSVAREYGVSPTEIIHANPKIRDYSKLMPGTTLNIPYKS